MSRVTKIKKKINYKKFNNEKCTSLMQALQANLLHPF